MIPGFEHLFSVGGGLTSNPTSGAVSDGTAIISGDFISPASWTRQKGLKALANNPGGGGDNLLVVDGSAAARISPLMVIAGVLGLAWLLFGRKRKRR